MKLYTVPLIAVVAMAPVASAWSTDLPRYSMTLLASPFQDVSCRGQKPFGRMLKEQEKWIEREFANMDRDFPRRRAMMEKFLERQFPNRGNAVASPCSDIMSAKKAHTPRYEITNNDNEVKIAVDVPGVDPANVNISVDTATRMLTISGFRESKNDGYSFSSKFSESFYLDSTVDIDNFSATLQDGVLVVTAPKEYQQLETTVRQIPIENIAAPPVETTSSTTSDSNDKNQENTADSPSVKINVEDVTNKVDESTGDEDVIDLSDDK